MKIYKNKDINDVISLVIEGDLIINNVVECKDTIVQHIKDQKDISINLSGITRIDTAGFQLLIAVQQEVIKRSKLFSIINPSLEVENIFTLYNKKI